LPKARRSATYLSTAAASESENWHRSAAHPAGREQLKQFFPVPEFRLGPLVAERARLEAL
jgi:hypothetical protein